MFELTFKTMNEALIAAKKWISYGNYSVIKQNADNTWTLSVTKH
jgi:hypothetical protein